MLEWPAFCRCWRICRSDCPPIHAKHRRCFLEASVPKFRPCSSWSSDEALQMSMQWSWQHSDAHWSAFQLVDPPSNEACLIHFCRDRRCEMSRCDSRLMSVLNICPCLERCLIQFCLSCRYSCSNDAMVYLNHVCNHRGSCKKRASMNTYPRVLMESRQAASWCLKCYDRDHNLSFCKKNKKKLIKFKLLDWKDI